MDRWSQVTPRNSYDVKFCDERAKKWMDYHVKFNFKPYLWIPFQIVRIFGDLLEGLMLSTTKWFWTWLPIPQVDQFVLPNIRRLQRPHEQSVINKDCLKSNHVKIIFAAYISISSCPTTSSHLIYSETFIIPKGILNPLFVFFKLWDELFKFGIVLKNKSIFKNNFFNDFCKNNSPWKFDDSLISWEMKNT